MNTLSWLIYFAEVSGRLSVSMGMLTVVLGIGVGTLIIGLIVTHLADDDEFHGLLKTFKLVAPAFILTGFIAIALPTQKTVYLIAGSEIVQSEAVTEEAKEIYDLLQEKLTGIVLRRTSP